MKTVKEKIEANDIVQIIDEEHHWFPSLIVVSEIKNFGIQGFCFCPKNDYNTPTGLAYIRLKEGQYEKVGKATIVPREEDENN